MPKLHINWTITIPALLLSLLGILVLRSVSPSLVGSQIRFLLISTLFFLIFSYFDYKTIFSFHLPIYFLSILFLSLPFIFNVVTRGTHRWLQFGSSSIQPSEVVKPFLLMTFTFLAVSSIKNRSLWLVGALLFPALIIFFQPDLGTTIVLSVGWVVPLIFQLKLKHLVWAFLAFSLLAPLTYKYVLQDYQRERLSTFFNPYRDPLGKGYNVIQSIIAVGSGEIFGRGLGRGTQSQLRFLPEQHTDFVFSSLTEELGFVGGCLVLSLYLFIFWRLYRISQSVYDVTASLYCLSVLAMLSFQVFINIGMNIGIAPVTGITLPLLSYGGSSLLSLGIILGIVNSISRESGNHYLIEIS